jgi:hypothetical protein
MKTLADPTALLQLVDRLNALRPNTPRQWGALTPGEMLCHLADATSSHGAFGPMTPADWHRWAYRHTDHHLRQFGL